MSQIFEIESINKRLSAPFPNEALSVDPSRGSSVVLIGVKGYWVIERLNEVLGPCGIGWRYSVGGYETDGKVMEAKIIFQYRVGKDGVGPCNFDESGTVKYLSTEDGHREVWSEPIVSYGNQHIISNRKTDAKKGSVTAAISKAASMIGVGIENYKGMLSYEDGEVVMASKGKSKVQLSFEMVLTKLANEHPEMLQGLREVDELIESWVSENMLRALAEIMREADLSTTAKELQPHIIGRSCGFSEMTVSEIGKFTNTIIDIANGDATPEEIMGKDDEVVVEDE